MIVTTRLTVDTLGDGQVFDLNEEVKRRVADSGVHDGHVTIFTTHTTNGVTIMEYEPGLVQDLNDSMERMIPRSVPYQHNILNNDINGHSHTRAVMIGQSLVVPVQGGLLLLGMHQHVVLIDLDARPRQRELVIQIMGE